MSFAISIFNAAMERAIAGRPAVGGFPYLAETLRAAGVSTNEWNLPSCQSVYITDEGPIVMQGTPLTSGIVDIPAFNETAIIQALREDQAGKTTFPEFLEAIWKAGVVRYVVYFDARTVIYQGIYGDEYEESYPIVTLTP